MDENELDENASLTFAHNPKYQFRVTNDDWGKKSIYYCFG